MIESKLVMATIENLFPRVAHAPHIPKLGDLTVWPLGLCLDKVVKLRRATLAH